MCALGQPPQTRGRACWREEGNEECATICLLKYQLEVTRLKNKEVEQNFPAACSAIDAKVKERLASLHGPQAAPSFEVCVSHAFGGAGAEGD